MGYAAEVLGLVFWGIKTLLMQFQGDRHINRNYFGRKANLAYHSMARICCFRAPHFRTNFQVRADSIYYKVQVSSCTLSGKTPYPSECDSMHSNMAIPSKNKLVHKNMAQLESTVSEKALDSTFYCMTETRKSRCCSNCCACAGFDFSV